MVKINEIFTSIQGEGPFVGYKQIFIRLCGCNLNCKYCDTDYDSINAKEYSIDDVISFIRKNINLHSVSLTGGEPLLHENFITDLSQNINNLIPIYLETNGTLYKALENIVDCITYISADIKLPSATGLKPLWEEHERFFKIASSKMLFAKAVFNEDITDDEIKKMSELCRQYNIELILQPMMINDVLSVSSEAMIRVLNSCLEIHKQVRLIPQVHKFINVI